MIAGRINQTKVYTTTDIPVGAHTKVQSAAVHLHHLSFHLESRLLTFRNAQRLSQKTRNLRRQQSCSRPAGRPHTECAAASHRQRALTITAGPHSDHRANTHYSP